MTTGLGHKGGFFAYGEESTWGTVIARTAMLDLRTGGDGVEVTQDNVMAEEIPSISLDIDESVVGDKRVAGPLVFNAQYEGHEKLLEHALGSVATTQPDATNASSTYQHVFSIADALPVGLSLEINRDTEELLVEGGVITSMEWAIDLNAILIVTMNVVGEDAAFTTNPTGALTAPTAPYVLYSDAPSAGICVYNSVEVKVTTARWSIDNSLDIERRFLGSNLIAKPLRSGKILVTGSFTAEFEDSTLYDDFIAHQERTLQFKFEGATIEGAYKYTYQVDFANMRLMAGTPRTDNEGRILVPYEFRAFLDGSDKEMTITLINTTTSV